MHKLFESYQKYREIIHYIFFGGLTTLLNWVVYGVVMTLGADVFVGNSIAWAASILFAFVTNKLWVFESRVWTLDVLKKEGSSFLGSRLFTGVLEIVGVPALVYVGMNQTIFGIEGFLAKMVVSVVVIALNYILSKVFVFKK